MFRIIRGKGFHITFKNGYTISVQFGCNDYCENYNDYRPPSPLDKNIFAECKNAEIAILDKDEMLINVKDWNEKVKGYCSAEEVLKWINYTASLPEQEKND